VHEGFIEVDPLDEDPGGLLDAEPRPSEDDDARATLTIVERAYQLGGATILDLLDAARTSQTIQQNYIEALFAYQRNVFLLGSAVGRELPS
jgi:outer membrane protein TolC